MYNIAYAFNTYIKTYINPLFYLYLLLGLARVPHPQHKQPTQKTQILIIFLINFYEYFQNNAGMDRNRQNLNRLLNKV